MLRSQQTMEDGKKSQRRRQGPLIPVRENRRTTFVPLSGMNGDHLPDLRKLDRTEFADKTQHFNATAKTQMWKKVNLLFKEHNINMGKIRRGQDSVYKILCRVHREKRRVQREEYVRKQQGVRERIHLHRLRVIMKKVVAKFKENVRRKKQERAAEAKSTSRRGSVFPEENDDGKDESAVKTKLAPRRGSLKKREIKKKTEKDKQVEISSPGGKDGSGKPGKDADTEQIIHNKIPRDQGTEASLQRITKTLQRSVSDVEREKKITYVVRTAENRDRFGEPILGRYNEDNKDKDHRNEAVNDFKGRENTQEATIRRLPNKVLEVRKDDESYTRVKELDTGAPPLRSNVQNIEGRNVQDDVENDQDPEDQGRGENKKDDAGAVKPTLRISVWEKPGFDDSDKDYGWFTYGNPGNETVVVSVGGNSRKISKNDSQGERSSTKNTLTKEKGIKEECLKSPDSVQFTPSSQSQDTGQQSGGNVVESPRLLPLKQRRVGHIRPPDFYLKDNYEKNKVSEVLSSENREKATHVQRSIRKGDEPTEQWYPVQKVVSVDISGSPDDKESSNNATLSDTLSSAAKRNQTASYKETSFNRTPKLELNLDEQKPRTHSKIEFADICTYIIAKRSDSVDSGESEYYNPKQAQQTQVSSNMVWVMKQERKSQAQRRARILDKESVSRYRRDSHGNLVQEKAPHKREHVSAPSYKEHYTQQKLLRDERGAILNQKIKISSFYGTISAHCGQVSRHHVTDTL